jgi:hypothetical protein
MTSVEAERDRLGLPPLPPSLMPLRNGEHGWQWWWGSRAHLRPRGLRVGHLGQTVLARVVRQGYAGVARVRDGDVVAVVSVKLPVRR